MIVLAHVIVGLVVLGAVGLVVLGAVGFFARTEMGREIFFVCLMPPLVTGGVAAAMILAFWSLATVLEYWGIR